MNDQVFTRQSGESHGSEEEELGRSRKAELVKKSRPYGDKGPNHKRVLCYALELDVIWENDGALLIGLSSVIFFKN